MDNTQIKAKRTVITWQIEKFPDIEGVLPKALVVGAKAGKFR